MIGDGSGAGAGARGAGLGGAGAAGRAEEDAPGGLATTTGAAFAIVADARVAVEETDGIPAWAGDGACNNDAPHIPQKRFVSGFSLPQRGQRT